MKKFNSHEMPDPAICPECGIGPCYKDLPAPIRISFKAFPIETAPKDRVGIMIYCPLSGWNKGFFNAHHGWCTYRDHAAKDCTALMADDQPTHWAEITAMSPLQEVTEEERNG